MFSVMFHEKLFLCADCSVLHFPHESDESVERYTHFPLELLFYSKVIN